MFPQYIILWTKSHLALALCIILKARGISKKPQHFYCIYKLCVFKLTVNTLVC